MVGDGHAMGVAPQILQHELRATERRFQVDDPVLSVQGSQPGGKDLRLRKKCEISLEAELAITESLPEGIDKLSAKDFTQHFVGKKEPLGCGNPVSVIGRESAGGNDAMNMRVSFELLTPGVQHTEEADFGTEMLGIASDFQKGFRTAAKQEIIEDLLVLQHQRGQMTGKRENHMDVASREQFLATRFDPTVAGSRLTLWTMPVATAVIRDGGTMPATGALVEVTAERGGATACNGQQHFDMLPADPPAATFDEAVSRSADEIGNFENGPVHLLVLQQQLVEMGHGNLAVTHTYTSNERQPLIRSAHAKRSPPGGYVQTVFSECGPPRSQMKFPHSDKKTYQDLGNSHFEIVVNDSILDHNTIGCLPVPLPAPALCQISGGPMRSARLLVVLFFLTSSTARILVLLTSLLSLYNLRDWSHSGTMARIMIGTEVILAVFLLYWLNTRQIRTFFRHQARETT